MIDGWVEDRLYTVTLGVPSTLVLRRSTLVSSEHSSRAMILPDWMCVVRVSGEQAVPRHRCESFDGLGVRVRVSEKSNRPNLYNPPRDMC